MSNTTITVDGVDMPLLNTQRHDLHALLLKHHENGEPLDSLWGLLGLLDHICDKYETETHSWENEVHFWHDDTDTRQVICSVCGLEQHVGKGYWDYLEEETK